MKINSLKQLIFVGLMVVGLLLTACAPNVDRLISDLKKENEVTRRRAAEKLGDLGDPQAVDALIRALSDQDYQVRMNAITALGNIGDPKAVEPLLNTHWVHTTHQKTEEAVKDALVDMGESAVQELISYLANAEIFVSHEQDEKRGVAMYALGKIDSAIDDLVAALENEELRVGAAMALKRIGYLPPNETARIWYGLGLRDEEVLIKLGSAAVEPLIDLLKDEDDELCIFAAQTLGEIGDPQAVDALMEALNASEFDGVQATALVALGQIGSPDAIQAIINTLHNQKFSSRVLEFALEELVKIGEPAIEPLATGFPSKYGYLALGEIGGQQVIELLTDRIINAQDIPLSYHTKFYAPVALVMASEDDVSVLFPFLQNKDTVWVYGSLIYLGREGSEDELIEALNKFGDEDMANVYLNCGNSRLESAASSWAYQHGYSVVTLQGGSSGGQWGGQ